MVLDAGWPGDLSDWPDLRNAPGLCPRWSHGPPGPSRGSSRVHTCVEAEWRYSKHQSKVKTKIQYSICVQLTLGWHWDHSCTSSTAGPSSRTVESWSSGCCLRCTGSASHLWGNSCFCSPWRKIFFQRPVRRNGIQMGSLHGLSWAARYPYSRSIWHQSSLVVIMSEDLHSLQYNPPTPTPQKRKNYSPFVWSHDFYNVNKSTFFFFFLVSVLPDFHWHTNRQL